MHLLQKRALRIVKNTDYVAHSEPICKDLRLLKMPDMFRFALWKFYFKLMNNKLPSYFENMKPVLPRICDNYDIRRPSFHLPLIKHDFAEQLISYQLTTMLNENGSTRFSSKVFTHSLAKIQSRNAGQGWSSVKKLFVVRLSAAISATCLKMLAPEENAGSSIYPLKSAALFLWPAILRRSHHCTHAVLLHTHIL